MVNDLISLIVRINLALAVGIALVLALRVLARRGFGARVAYALWLLPVLAAGACFLPPRIERLTIAEPSTPVSSSFSTLAGAPQAAVPHLEPAVWLVIWCAGFVLSLAVLALRQGRFSRALGRLQPRDDLGAGVFGAETCEHGPAVIGVLRPIIVTPADFDQRYSDEERRIVLAHERAHLAQGDPLINAFVVALQCANWFNPFVHIGARALRLDQELAADAAVLATSARRPYAEAILKTQIVASAPLGAAWPPNSAQSLKERIAMLKRNLPTRTQRLIGVSAVALVAAGACAAAWAAQPAQVIVSDAPHIARADAAPFIEPPVNDVSQLAGAPQGGEWQQAFARTDAAPGIATASEQSDDENADDASDNADAANADDSDSENVHTVISIDGHTVTTNRHLTPQERARIHAQVRAALEQSRHAQTEALVAQRQALADARDAQAEGARAAREAQLDAAQASREAQLEAARATREGQIEAMRAAREAQAEGMRAAQEAQREAADAAREAQAESIRAAVESSREINSPQMQAEIRAMAAESAQMAHSVHMSEAQRDEMRADIRAHAAHLRALSRRNCTNAHHAHDDDTQHD